jgi:hypothetical protein
VFILKENYFDLTHGILINFTSKAEPNVDNAFGPYISRFARHVNNGLPVCISFSPMRITHPICHICYMPFFEVIIIYI